MVRAATGGTVKGMRVLMGLTDNPLTRCDQDIELNASRPG
jgi:hypothetical protein